MSKEPKTRLNVKIYRDTENIPSEVTIKRGSRSLKVEYNFDKQMKISGDRGLVPSVAEVLSLIYPQQPLHFSQLGYRVTSEYELYVIGANSVAANELVVKMVCMSLTGEIIYAQYDTTATGGNKKLAFAYTNMSLEVFPLPFPVKEGYLLAVGVSCNQSAKRGEVYCYYGVRRKDGRMYHTLASGYISPDTNTLYWNCYNSRNEHTLEGPGLDRVITIANPAAQTDLSQTVPANVVWKVKSLRFRYVSDANPANRRQHYKVTDGTNTFCRLDCGVNQVASDTRDFCFFLGAGDVNTSGDDYSLPIPPYLLYEGYTIESDTDNKQATDQISLIVLVVEQWRL